MVFWVSIPDVRQSIGKEDSMMDEAMLKLISDGFTTMQTTFTSIIALAVPVSVTVVAIGAGVNYALKKIKGVLSKAS